MVVVVVVVVVVGGDGRDITAKLYSTSITIHKSGMVCLVQSQA